MIKPTEIQIPAFLKLLPAEIWKKYAPTLTASGKLTDLTADMFGVWCCEMFEFQQAPEKFGAARLTQLRLYAHEFGLLPEATPETEGEKSDPAEQYFDKPTKPRLVKGA